MENSPVLFYKEQGLEDAVFDKNDFVLIIMTDFQANCLSKFGSNKICIDGTHGLNAYGCQLYTILVVNDYGSGMTVAFCFSNRQDIAIFKFMFEIIKKSVGVITTEVFMSDDYPAFYLAWESIMGRVDKRLLCTWRKGMLVLKSLKLIKTELDQDIFKQQLNTFCQDLLIDNDTLAFGEYFRRFYVNRTQLWAYCFRKYTGINTNMYLESLHKVIKDFYLEGKRCKRLDKNINSLINLVTDKIFERIINIE
ncbi:hypothetical protein HUJ04_006963 [Dendroctonus ponderosae]|nr:hypothetical protein HUJ04_006963 [Dendroctonus ponderosae]